jgi:glycosyltransferase involved in cell wall biosynthesis
MKTMHFTNSWHENSGGIATFYRALIEEANRRRQPIRLVVPAARDRIEEIGEFGRIYHVEAPPAPFNSDYRAIYPSQFLFPGSKLQAILASERPDLVEICDKYTLNYLGAVLRLRLLPAIDFRPVVTAVSQERMDDNVSAYLGSVPLLRALCSLYMRWLYFPFFDHHIANSEYTAAELRPAAQGQLVPRGTWIRPMGVDLAHLSPQRRSPALRRRLLQNFGASEESTLLLYAGRLVPEKNLALLFDLLTHLAKDPKRDYRLLVVGDGIERAKWEEKCGREIPGRSVFLGHCKDKNVLGDLYANCDVFVHPNPREPFGIAPLEAMASGLPLVAPNTGGVISYANAQNAWTVNADVISFAGALEQIAANRQLRLEKIGNALATAQHYRWETVAATFLDLYEMLTRATNAKPETLPGAAFQSTSAAGLRATIMHGVSQMAARGFRLASRFAPEPQSRRRQVTTDLMGSS